MGIDPNQRLLGLSRMCNPTPHNATPHTPPQRGLVKRPKRLALEHFPENIV
ncbi:MAG: hypothetical protein KME31_26150 [Tolypothrix carrinoi HA7290-LM1]|nr:hypothetical protein [Tolypothrix carrinoi HA7290-LM1]